MRQWRAWTFVLPNWFDGGWLLYKAPTRQKVPRVQGYYFGGRNFTSARGNPVVWPRGVRSTSKISRWDGNLNFHIYFSAGASPILIMFDCMEDLGETERIQVLRCCAEGGLLRSKLRKLLLIMLCCSAVVDVQKWIGRGPERYSFATYIKAKYYAKDRSVLEMW